MSSEREERQREKRDKKREGRTNRADEKMDFRIILAVVNQSTFSSWPPLEWIE